MSDDQVRDETKVKLHQAKIPDTTAGKLKACLALYRQLTGKEPTPQDIAAAKQTLTRR